MPDAERIAAIVFVGSRYLAGAEAIRSSLESVVKTGRGIGTHTAIEKSEEQPLSAWSVGGTLAAGAIAGLNPCALSMLLLFLSVLLQGNRHAGRYVMAFLLLKYVCHLLIGTALLGLLQRLNPAWLLPAARWTLTLGGGRAVPYRGAFQEVDDGIRLPRRTHGRREAGHRAGDASPHRIGMLALDQGFASVH